MAGLLDEVLGLGIGPHAMAALDSPSRLADFRRDQAPASRGGSVPGKTGSPASDSPGSGTRGWGESDSGTPGPEESGPGSAGPDGSGSAGSAASGAADSLLSGTACSPERRAVDSPPAEMPQPASSRTAGASSRELDRPPRHKRRLRRALRRRSR
jgi:hypothetical protein